MPQRSDAKLWWGMLAFAIVLLGGSIVAEEKSAREIQKNAVAVKGQRVFSVGHSFHVFMPAILRDLAKKAGIADHVQVGLSSIGGSRVIQHWNVPDDKFKVKQALRD